MSRTNPLAALLGESRDELAARLDAQDTFSRWAELVPELAVDASISSVSDLLAALEPESAPTRWDALLWSLLRLAAADGEDESDAVLAVIHAVAGGAARLLRRGFDAGLVLGELAVQIRTFPWSERTRAVAANLLRDTEHALCCESSPAWMRTRGHVQRVREFAVGNVSDHVAEGVTGGGGGDDLDLVDLLLWAERTGVVDARGLSMLVEYHYSREATGAGHEHVAKVFAVSVRTSKRRCTAAITALRTAAPEYLAS